MAADLTLYDLCTLSDEEIARFTRAGGSGTPMAIWMKLPHGLEIGESYPYDEYLADLEHMLRLAPVLDDDTAMRFYAEYVRGAGGDSIGLLDWLQRHIGHRVYAVWV